MSRVDDLRQEFEVASKIAALEDEIEALKAAEPTCGECGRRTGGKSDELRAVQAELRAWRHVLRLGRELDDPESVAQLEAIRQLAKGA